MRRTLISTPARPLITRRSNIARLVAGGLDIDLLSDDATINSVQTLPNYRYAGRDATLTDWPGWGYGSTLTFAGASAPTLLARAAGCKTKGVQFAASSDGSCYTAPDNTVGEIDDASDFMIEAILVDPGTAAYHALWSKAGTNTPRMRRQNSGRQINIYGNNGFTVGGPVLAAAGVSVTHQFWDRSENSTNGGASYLNGSRQNVFNGASAGTYNAAAAPLKINSLQAASTVYGWSAPIILLSLYLRAGWFAGGATNITQWDAWVAARYASLLA